MLDFILGLAFAGLIVRGWRRGFVRETMDLVGMLAGIAIGFRLSAPVGEFLADWTGMSAELARLSAGLAIFVAVGLGASLLARYLQRVANLPGLRMGNKALGSAMALAWGVFLAILVLSVAVALPLPSSVDNRMKESAIAQQLVDPAGLPQMAFQVVAGDQVLEAVVNLDQLVGLERVIVRQDETLELQAVDRTELERDDEAADLIYELVNTARLDGGLDTLTWSSGLADVARSHGREMYLEGYFGHDSPESGDVSDRVAAAGIPFVLVGENLALAPTARTVHDGLIGSEGHRANILEREFTKIGIGAIRGPLGLMVVQVFAR